MKTNETKTGGELRLSHISKAFDGTPVFSDLSLTLEAGKTYCLMAPSGTGKTTLLRILMGLEKADAGTITGLAGMQLPGTQRSEGPRSKMQRSEGLRSKMQRSGKRISAVFQEDRLLEGYSVIENIRFVTGSLLSAEELQRQALRLLPGDSLAKPVCEFSGGMRRRAAILRACLAPSEIVLMDEPFSGLDEETKRQTIDFIADTCRGKLLLIATHAEEDAKKLKAEVIRLEP